MDTRVVREENGVRYNRFDEEVVACSGDCGQDTTMTGTQLCDACWEVQRSGSRDRSNEGEIAEAVSLLKGFIEFVEVPEIQAVIDGAFDPDRLMVCAKRFVDKHQEAKTEGGIS